MSEEIRCIATYNDNCIKCKNVKNEMVRVGAIYMCKECFSVEFNIKAFDADSDLGQKYNEWIGIKKKRDENSLNEWVKKLGQQHWIKSGESNTLCGKPALGNNYSCVIKDEDKAPCELCKERKEEIESDQD